MKLENFTMSMPPGDNTPALPNVIVNTLRSLIVFVTEEVTVTAVADAAPTG